MRERHRSRSSGRVAPGAGAAEVVWIVVELRRRLCVLVNLSIAHGLSRSRWNGGAHASAGGLCRDGRDHRLGDLTLGCRVSSLEAELIESDLKPDPAITMPRKRGPCSLPGHGFEVSQSVRLPLMDSNRRPLPTSQSVARYDELGDDPTSKTGHLQVFPKPSVGLEPTTPSLPWKCSTS